MTDLNTVENESNNNKENTVTPAPELTQEDLYFQECLNNTKEIEDALFDFCFHFNYFYDRQLIGSLIMKEENITQNKNKLGSIYVSFLKSNPKYNGLTFLSQIKRDNFEKLYSEDLSLLSLSEDDKKNRGAIMNIIGYDPFKNEADEDRPQMYRDLTGLLTENLRKDIAKQKAAIEIVKNYSTIAKYQKRVSELMNSGQVDQETQDMVDNLLQMIAKIQGIVNATTKENGFSSGKSLGIGGKGMLSDVMNQVETQYFDEGITNFYDQATSKSIQEISDISFRSQMNQIKLTGTEYTDILIQQADIVRKAQRTARDALEGIRIAKSKITKQKLLEELEKEYRKKGISEADIQEFIDREYKLYEGN